MSDLEYLNTAVVNLALILPRVAAAFLILPLLTSEIVPSMVRNIFLVSVSLSMFPFVATDALSVSANGAALGPIILKEIFIGVVLAYSFSIIFWALEGAGQVIDAKIGTTTAQITDPLSGHQTSLNGSFFSHFAGYLFVAAGGLLVFFDLLFSSYAIWPISSPFPELSALGSVFFVSRFDELMRLILLLAAPALVLLSLVEFGLGFVNRYAEKLNIFSLSMSIKAWLGTFIIILMITTVAEFMLDWLADQHNLLDAIRRAL